MSTKRTKLGATERSEEPDQSHDDTPLATALEETAFQPDEPPRQPQQTEWQALTADAVGIVRRNPLVSVGVAAVLGYLASQTMRLSKNDRNGNQPGIGRLHEDCGVLGQINGPRTKA